VTRELFQEVPCKCAEELLTELAPHSGYHLWDRPDHKTWIFRGQSEAVWHLTPAAMRKDVFLRFIPGQREMYATTPAERRKMEEGFAKEFAAFANEFGFEIPGDGPELRDPEYSVYSDGLDFPPRRERPLYALAQHYGVRRNPPAEGAARTGGRARGRPSGFPSGPRAQADHGFEGSELAEPRLPLLRHPHRDPEIRGHCSGGECGHGHGSGRLKQKST
jgi:hypothetical protein